MKRALLVISAIAFFCLQITTKLFAAGVLVSVPFLIWFAVRHPEWAVSRRMSKAGKVFCSLTAMGVCLWPIDRFAGWLRSITVFQRLQGGLGVEMGLFSQLTAITFAVAGLLFVYQMISLFYERLFVVVREIRNDFTGEEGTVALAAAAIVMTAVVLVYLRTDVFASPVVTRDLLYTSDSGAIVHENAYLSFSALENDFRSPLFAVFAAPLLGLPYLISRVLPIPNAQALVLVAAQVPLLIASFALLMKLIPGVCKPTRMLLPVAMLTTYSAILFTLMAEQYTIALFYLSLGLYGLLRHGRREQLYILGAAGTMLPGAALALIPEHKEKKAAAIAMDTLKSAGWGLVLLCTMGSFGVLLRIPEALHNVSRFTGAQVALSERLPQFLSFVGQVFIAPQAGAVTAADGYAKWRLTGTGGGVILGIVLLVLAGIGFILNRKQSFAKISMAWVAVSFILLCVLGWGTTENGLTLYTLYFGWAYAALLVYLIESLCKACKMGSFSWVIHWLWASVLLIYNLPQLREIVLFGIAHYPV